MKNVNFNCPVCGSNLTVSESVNNATVSSKCNCSAGTTSATAKIEKLKQAGVNVSNLFAVQDFQGNEMIGRLESDGFHILPDNDPIFASIVKSGTVPNRRLFRRWVMAQMFHMLTAKDWKGNTIGFTQALNDKGYKYQWEMVLEEFRVQSKLCNRDLENFFERRRWFNKEVVVSMAEDYIKQLKAIVDKLPRKHCKKIPYVRLQSKNIFVVDLESKVFQPLHLALIDIKSAQGVANLYKAVFTFYHLVKQTYSYYYMPQDKAFKDAYKGAGAYYTLKNLIMFHGCTFPGKNREESLKDLKKMLDDEYLKGYQLLGMLKKFLDDNNINIKAKQAEWRKGS